MLSASRISAYPLRKKVSCLGQSPLYQTVSSSRSLTQMRSSASMTSTLRSSYTRVARPVSHRMQHSHIRHLQSAVYVAPTASKFRLLGRLSLGVLTLLTGAFAYSSYQWSHPPDQLPYDPEKKTIVVLGSGWGATSFLKEIDTTHYNVVVISKRNYFLYTPLLPSVSVSTLSGASIIQPTRYITRHKSRHVTVYEADVTEVDAKNKTVTFSDHSEIQGDSKTSSISYDFLVYALGCDNQTFGMEGVKKHACFLKELGDAEKIQKRLMDCLETAAFKGQSESEIERLLHMVVVGGGPTGVEYAAELQDFLREDLLKWYPEVAGKLKITLIEALPRVLRGFSDKSVTATEKVFRESGIDMLTNTMVKDIKEKSVTVQGPDKQLREIPYGVIVWAGGLAVRDITKSIMNQLPEFQTERRGLAVDDLMQVKGASGLFAIGDATATQYFPTAQTASQQGTYLAQTFKKMAEVDALESKLAAIPEPAAGAEASIEAINLVQRLQRTRDDIKGFQFTNQGSLAYIGSEKAIADLSLFGYSFAANGWVTQLFWRSVYVSKLYSLRNRTMVTLDWLGVKFFGRTTSRTD